MTQIYDATADALLRNGYIDVDEDRVRQLDSGMEIPYRYLHGGFRDTDIRFSLCYPHKEQYKGRFYQYLSPFPGPQEELASLNRTGEDDKIAFCLLHGAYYVESNMGSGAAFTSSDDRTLTHRSSALTAEFSRIKAREIYGYEHRPYGYVYGGSGGGYRTIACIENTNAYDGAVPYVIGSPYAIPNCQTTRAYAQRILRNKMPDIIDALDAGGSGDPWALLDEEECAALREATLFGYPLRSWFASADLNDGALPVLAPGVKAMDPEYFKDYWTVPGYLGADANGNAVRDRICLDSRISRCGMSDEGEQRLQTTADVPDDRNGVNDAWKKRIREAGDVELWIELENIPQRDDWYLKGAVLEIVSGKAAGRRLQIQRIEDQRVYLTEGFAMSPVRETWELLEAGDEVHMDNSDYLAIQTYHRHQVPSADYHAWDQFRDADGQPLYPQRTKLLGPSFCGNGPGCEQNGRINGKIIIVASLMDEQAYPWQADWYRRKVSSVHGGNDAEICRLWYMDNVFHDDRKASDDELHVTTYLSGLWQALIDLADWVEQGKEPLPSSRYKVNGGLVEAGDTAAERGGIQPVVHLYANGSKCAHVRSGEQVVFRAEAEVPQGAGVLTSVEFSYEGEQDFPYKGSYVLSDGGRCGVAESTHSYAQAGTYYAVVRVRSQREGDAADGFTQVRNIDRVRIVVE